MHTRSDVITQAFRFLNIVAEDEVATGDMFAFASRTLEAIAAGVAQEIDAPFSPDDVGTAQFNYLAMLLSVDLAAAYGVPAMTSRARAYMRLISTLRSDDREEPLDYAAYY